MPTACPSQLFKVWQCGRVWYQWNADCLLAALVPLTSSQLLHLLHSLPLCLSLAFSSFTTCRKGELARRCFKGLSPFSHWQPWLCKCRAVTLATALIPLHFKPQEVGLLFLVCSLANIVRTSLALQSLKWKFKIVICIFFSFNLYLTRKKCLIENEKTLFQGSSSQDKTGQVQN